MSKLMTNINIIISSIAIISICVVLMSLQYEMRILHVNKRLNLKSEQFTNIGCDIGNFFDGKQVLIDGRTITLSANAEHENYWLKQPSSYEVMSISQANELDIPKIRQRHYGLRLEGWGRLKQSYKLQEWGEPSPIENTCTFNQALLPVPINSTSIADNIFRVNQNKCVVDIDPYMGDLYEDDNLKVAQLLNIETDNYGNTCVLQINKTTDVSSNLQSVLNLLEKVGQKLNEPILKEFKTKNTQINANNLASNVLRTTTIPSQERALSESQSSEANATANVARLDAEIRSFDAQIDQSNRIISSLKVTIENLTNELVEATGERAQRINALRNQAYNELKDEEEKQREMKANKERADKEKAIAEERVRAENERQRIEKEAREVAEKLRKETAAFILRSTFGKRQCIDGNGSSLYVSGGNGCNSTNGYQLYTPRPGKREGQFLLQHRVSNKCLDAGGGGNTIYFNGSCDKNNDWQNFTLPPPIVNQPRKLQNLQSKLCISEIGNGYKMENCNSATNFLRIIEGSPIY